MAFPVDENYSDESYVVQMRDMRMVSRNIAHYYLITAPYLSRAAKFSYGGTTRETKQHENLDRMWGIEYFSTLVMMSYNLPHVEEEFKKQLNDKIPFKDGDELLTKLWNADRDGVTSKELVDWWMLYTKALVKSGLINAYDMRDSTLKSYRKY